MGIATPIPMARSSDPATSHEAAARYRLSKRRRQVLRLVREHPGSTAGELSAAFYATGVSIRLAAETPHKRLPELETLGFVRRGAVRLCTDSGQRAATWYATIKGETHHD